MSDNATPTKPPVLVLCRDLLFASKITATAQARNVPFKVVRDPANLAGQPGRKLIVDLNQDGAIDAAAAWKQETLGETVGFVAHVDAATIAKAKDAGIDDVMARSEFSARIDEIVR